MHNRQDMAHFWTVKLYANPPLADEAAYLLLLRGNLTVLLTFSIQARFLFQE